MDVLVPDVCSNRGTDKRITIFHLHQSFTFINLYFSLPQFLEPTPIPWFLPSLLFFSILSSMSFLDSRLAIDLGPENPTKQMSQEYGDHRMLEWAHNIQVMPFSQAMSRDIRTGRNQTASLFAGLLEFAARRSIVLESRREGLVKVDDTPYSTARLMRFGGQHTDPSDVFSIADNEQEDRHFPAGDSKVMSVKPTASTTETPGGPLSANSEEARVISIDKDSDMESLTTRGPKKYSPRHGQPLATLRNPGSEDDYWGETKVNICQEVSLASDTTGFHSINNTETTSDPNPHTVVFDNFGDTQTNDNFGPTQAKDSPLISTEKNLSINQQTSDTVKGISSKLNKHKSDQPKSTRDARRKRVRAEAFENTVIFLGSDSEDEIEVVP